MLNIDVELCFGIGLHGITIENDFRVEDGCDMVESIDFFPIQVEQCSWHSAAPVLTDIRTRVFIEEQGVPEGEEFDDRDGDAVHWVAWGESHTPMGVARLVGNRVGRMAVLAQYRRKGVASAILRAIISHAVNNGLERLELDAQLHAVGFYEGFGFTIAGDEFLDVGIAHVPMAMDLGRYVNRRPEPRLPDISEEMRHRHQFDSVDECRWSALQLARHSDRYIRIFSDQLEPRIYDNEAFCQAVYNLATDHPLSRVMILVRDTDTLSRHFHRLVETFYRLSSHIELRRLTREMDTPHQEFITGDVAAVMYCQDPRRFVGYLCLYSPLEAKRLNEEFDALWHHSEPDPRIRQLHI